jgi:hypothetical protein
MEKSAGTNVHSHYNGQVYLIPTDSWALAVWAATRRTRVNIYSGEIEEPIPFGQTYTARGYSPILWYTPGGALSGDIYSFLHRLPCIRTIVVLCGTLLTGLPKLDIENLQAMLDEFAESEADSQSAQVVTNLHVIPFFTDEPDPVVKKRRPSLLTGEDADYCGKTTRWLSLHERLTQVVPEESPIELPRVVIIVPASPLFACAVVPLAAYVQAVLVCVNPNTVTEEDFTSLANEVVNKQTVEEVWLVGPTQSLKQPLREAVRKLRTQKKQFNRSVAVRIIPGNDHFAVSEQVAVMLLT